MKKRYILPITLILLISLVIGAYGSYAWFTSKAESSSDNITTGSLVVGIGKNSYWWDVNDKSTLPIIININPGDEITTPLIIENQGSLNLSYKVKTNIGQLNNYDSIKNKIMVDVTNADSGILLFSGKLGDISSSLNKDDTAVNGFIKASHNQTLNFKFYWPSSNEDNKYQSKAVKVSFDIYAIQFIKPTVDGDSKITISDGRFAEYGYSKFAQVDDKANGTNSYIYVTDDADNMYVLLKGYPSGYTANLYFGNTSHLFSATASSRSDGTYQCNLLYNGGPLNDGSASAIAAAADDPSNPVNPSNPLGSIRFEFRISKSFLAAQELINENSTDIKVQTTKGTNNRGQMVNITNEFQKYVFKN
jgi:hypothetical protein